MATKTSNGTGGGNWSAGATWAGGVAPVDGDTVVIAAGDTVTLDVDITGWATGINGLTITSSSGTPGKLICSTTPGAYGFKMAGNTDIVGTNATNKGILQAGTSEAVPLPDNVTFTILLGDTADNTTARLYNRYLDVYLYGNRPTITHVRTTSAYVATDTAFAVDQDVTADATRPWAIGDEIAFANAVSTGNRDVEVLTITGVSSSTITCGAGLARNKNNDSLICLISRNVRVLIQSKRTATYDVMGAGGNAMGVFEFFGQVRDTRWTGGAGTGAPPNGDNNAWGFRAADGATGYQDNTVLGAIFVGLAGGSRSSGAAKAFTRFEVIVVGCAQISTSCQAYSADILAVCPTYAGKCFIGGTLRMFAGINGIGTTFAYTAGFFDKNSWIDYGEGLGSDNVGKYVYWDGAVTNSNRILGSVSCYHEFGKNARIGAGCTNGIDLRGGQVVLRGCRINHATPVTAGYLGVVNKKPGAAGLFGYDYADSSDVPQYGKLRCWMPAGEIESEAAPGTPPVTLAYAHKMSHAQANFSLAVEIPLVLEAGTPVEIVLYVKLNSGAYSWNEKPAFRLIDPAPYYDDADAIVAEAVDANGATLDETSTAWQTLYINYTLPVTANRPRGAKQNFVMRVRGEVSDATGTPYWHWNYTQSAIVNANVQYIEGEDATDALAKATCRFRGDPRHPRT